MKTTTVPIKVCLNEDMNRTYKSWKQIVYKSM